MDPRSDGRVVEGRGKPLISQSEELQDDDAKREVRDGEQTERRHRGHSVDGSARPIGRIHTNGDRNGQRNDLGHHHQHQ